MADGNGKSLWARFGLMLVPIALAGAAAVISLRAEVQSVKDDLQTKANRETVEAQIQTVEAQNRAVLQAIEDVRSDIRELRRVVVRP